MTKLLRISYLLGLSASLSLPAVAQMGFNSPSGVRPTQDLEIYSRNGFAVQRRYQYANADPNASINNLSCASPTPDLTTAAGTLKDPAGDGNYSAGINCAQKISVPTTINGVPTVGIELIFDDLDTEPLADYISIRDANGFEQLFSGNTPTRYIVLSSEATIRFVTNGNATVGRGFRLRWRALLDEPSTSPAPITFGAAMQFDVFRSSFKAGFANVSSGFNSLALGYFNVASGANASVLGSNNVASGYGTTVMGSGNSANGFLASTMGTQNVASGDYSSAMGRLVSTNSQTGSFIIGDADPNNSGLTTSTAANQFTARFAGGYRLLTTSGTSANGAVLAPNASSWATISDSTKKENFRPVDGASLLQKIGAMRVGTWNYKGQAGIRHYGPMAQDFFAAFGRDGLGTIGCDTLLENHDFTAVTFTAVQALVKENEQLKAEIARLKADATRADNRLNALENVLLNKKERVSAVRRKR
ncbi:tail fiber domain-containing protein [Rudanella lutea]|uniref:tail fiber domain-containing protein n=1 Tax=Rudanella lutea TaxID=451374 RepID=UPI0003623CAD|nr:tail fiber domain-containing protein [Rudanella lutea]